MNQKETIALWQRNHFTKGATDGSVELWSHTDAGYRKRTTENAQCDVTMATAADYSTGGERLTKQMAGNKYIPLPFYLDSDEAGRRLAEFMQSKKARSLNIAGNGIYTLELKGWTQQAANAWLFTCLSTAHHIYPIERIQSGGQTGIDWSGAVGAYELGIPALILFPHGFKQRSVDGVDRNAGPSELIQQIRSEAGALRMAKKAPSQKL